jgi:hypothetical protein
MLLEVCAMERNEALKNLELIKNVIMETRREIGKSRPFLYWWGPLILIASLLEQWFWLKMYHRWFPHLTLWGVFLIVGGLGSLIINRRQIKQRGGKFSATLTKKIGWIFGANFIFIWFYVFLSLELHVFKPNYIWAMATLLTGFSLFVTGIIIADRGFITLSIISLPVVVLMIRYTLWQPTIFGIYLGGGYIALAFFLKDTMTKGDIENGSNLVGTIG